MIKKKLWFIISIQSIWYIICCISYVPFIQYVEIIINDISEYDPEAEAMASKMANHNGSSEVATNEIQDGSFKPIEEQPAHSYPPNPGYYNSGKTDSNLNFSIWTSGDME